MKYIAKIQSGLKKYRVIPTNKKTSRVLDGSYRSIYKGRSLNFDELREYVVGDDVKDIDWKASARSQKLLVRQYVAEKKHNIMLLMDTNRRMLAEAPDGKEKRELALLAGGTLAYLVNQNGDYVSSTFAQTKKMEHHPFKTGLMNLEMILDRYWNAVTIENRSNLNSSLDYVLHNFHRRMILVVVTDRDGILSLSETTMKRLMVMHDALLIQIGDATMTGERVYNLEEEAYLPEFFTRDKKLAAIASEKRNLAQQSTEEKIRRMGIACTTISDVDAMDDQIVELLNRHKKELRK